MIGEKVYSELSKQINNVDDYETALLVLHGALHPGNLEQLGVNKTLEIIRYFEDNLIRKGITLPAQCVGFLNAYKKELRTYEGVENVEKKVQEPLANLLHVIESYIPDSKAA